MFFPISLVTLCHYGYRIFILTGLPGTELQHKCLQCGKQDLQFWHMLALRGILQSFARLMDARCSRTAAAPLTASGGALGNCRPSPWPWAAMAMGRHGQGPIGSDTEADTNGLLSWMLLTWSLASTTRFALIWMATWHMPCLQCLPLVSDLPLASLISCNLGNPDH